MGKLLRTCGQIVVVPRDKRKARQLFFITRTLKNSR